MVGLPAIALLAAILATGCTSSETSGLPAPGPIAVSSAPGAPQPRLPVKRPCADCRPNETCVHEHGRDAGAVQCALQATPQDLIDPNGVPGRGRDVPNVREDVIGELLLLKGVHFVKGGAWSTDMACATKPGALDDNCCNTCGQGVYLSGFGEIPVYTPDEEAVGCGGTCCKPLVCPKWLPVEEKALDVAGRFRTTTPPRQVLRTTRLFPTIYFQLAELPR